MNNVIVSNLKLQVALTEQDLSSKPIVPKYTALVRPDCCQGIGSCCPPPPPVRRCCGGMTDLELKNIEVQTYYAYAPKRGCCKK